MTQHPSQRFVLLTGAAGRIGSAFRLAHGHSYRFRLADKIGDGLAATPGGPHEVMLLDVSDAASCRLACQGIDTIIHLAADPDPDADWEGSLRENNIQGVVNIFRAASEAGCRRVIFASSVHAVAGYPPDIAIPDDASPRPINLYGASKAFGEAVASVNAAQSGLSGIAIRIGAYDAPWFYAEGTANDATAYLSARDMNDLLLRCLETPDIPYAIVAGISNNRRKRFDLRLTRDLLGYEPRDDGFVQLGLS